MIMKKMKKQSAVKLADMRMAVIFDRAEHTFEVYNENLADTRRPPCSTFKIISSLAGLESGVIDPENSVRPWSGERFWNDDWNRDMDFDSAFHTSCVWYYRQVIDEIGPEAMQDAVEAIGYGNCDLSDWEGRLNTNNSNPALTGFWIESSLKISPREQTEVLERIFGGDSEYTADVRAALEEVMFLSEASDETCAIYGKTGMGKANGVVADCWYAGFADVGRRIYFCIYLGETGRLSRKFCTGVVVILFCTLAGTVFANSQITGRLYLREQREYLRKISARLEEELRSGTAPKDAVRRIEQEEKVLIAYSAETGDPEILAG